MSSAWDTYDEMTYISRLGMNIHSNITTSRKELLDKYIKSLRNRKDWHGINKATVVNYAVQQLAMC